MWGQPPSAVHRAKPGFCFVSGHAFRACPERSRRACRHRRCFERVRLQPRHQLSSRAKHDAHEVDVMRSRRACPERSRRDPIPADSTKSLARDFHQWPVWDGHSRPLPLTLLLTLICHPEEAESHAKRATPDEELALSEAEGTYAVSQSSREAPEWSSAPSATNKPTPQTTVVIPNRAEGPVRKLMFADTSKTLTTRKTGKGTTFQSCRPDQK
jgi:hypothetical protein